MISPNGSRPIGILMSGGIDSSVLLAHLLDEGYWVQPFYIRSKLIWEREELLAVLRFVRRLDSPWLARLVTLDLPLTDLYDEHWSITGEGVPDAETPDHAVYLPGRNSLLIIKAAIWCQLNNIQQLALGTLKENPFNDADQRFFGDLERVLNRAGRKKIEIIRPFAEMTKRQVMQLGRIYPLEITFSCLDPIKGLHCGSCNKCNERIRGFAEIGQPDLTRYVSHFETAFTKVAG